MSLPSCASAGNLNLAACPSFLATGHAFSLVLCFRRIAVEHVSQFKFDLQIALAAAQRWRNQKDTMRGKERAQAKGQYDALDSKERLAKRANRLLRAARAAVPEESFAANEGLRAIATQPELRAEDMDNVVFERIIGKTNDLLGIRFFDAGKKASQAVCRIVLKLGSGRLGFGTGFLVSPSLLLTNHHVLETVEEAQHATAQFRYEPGDQGDAATPVEFALLPDRFFLTDKDYDFSLVAVASTSRNGSKLGDFGYCPLIAAEGKIVPGEPVNIIQHPRGGLKQVVIRENKLLDLPKATGADPKLDRYAQYEADTDQGSSGSPVFNDQWEVIALHHSGVPKTNDKGELVDDAGKVIDPDREPSRIVWIGNEGIRVSRLMQAISKAKNLSPEAEKLRRELLQISQLDGAQPHEVKLAAPKPWPEPGPEDVPHPQRARNGSVSVTLPLTVTVSLGGSGGQSLQVGVANPAPAGGTMGTVDTQEVIKPDEDYDNRPGFDANFLGLEVPLPKLDNTIAQLAAPVRGGGGTELKYYNYSVIMNAKRRMAFVSAVNLDGQAPVHFKREGGDRWFFDPRIDKKLQIGNPLYASNPYDRGHLTRRNDAAWGDTEEEAKRANDDTFHFTNCTPQHEVFNQSTKADQRGVLLWGNIENHIAEAASQDGRLCVFNGPVLRNNDPIYRDVAIPREFWKVVVCKADSGRLRALAFKLSQADLIREVPEEQFEAGPYQPFQIKIAQLEHETDLDFGDLHKFDPLESPGSESFFENDVRAVTISGLEDIVLEK